MKLMIFIKQKVMKLMRPTIKIILLVVAGLAAVGGVMLYAKTTMKPYDNPLYEPTYEQYVTAASKDISKVSLMQTIPSLDSLYITFTHSLSFQYGEGLIPDDKYDECLKKFVKDYVRVYVDICLSKLEFSKWNEWELTSMRNRVAEIRSLTAKCVDAILCNKETEEQMGKIDNVWTIYNQAVAAANVGGYTSLDDSKTKISNANGYTGNEYIKNCDELVERLNNVKQKLSNAHYKYLKNQVEQLSNYTAYITRESYTNAKKNIDSKIDDYKKSSIYGNYKEDVKTLEAEVTKYYNEGYEYLSINANN